MRRHNGADCAGSWPAPSSAPKTPPVVFAIFLIELALIARGIARSFGRGAGTIVGLTLMFPVFWCILGFGSAMYRRAATGPD